MQRAAFKRWIPFDILCLAVAGFTFFVTDDFINDIIFNQPFNLESRSIFGQFGFHPVFDFFGKLRGLDSINQHIQGVSISLFDCILFFCKRQYILAGRGSNQRTEPVAGRAEIFRCRKRWYDADIGQRTDIIHNISGNGPPFRFIRIVDLDSITVSFVKQQCDFIIVKKTQKFNQLRLIEIWIPRRIWRIVDNDSQIFAETIPQVAGIIK